MKTYLIAINRQVTETCFVTIDADSLASASEAALNMALSSPDQLGWHVGDNDQAEPYVTEGVALRDEVV